MITAKGREELRKLLSSDLVNDWEETRRTLRNVLKMLLLSRPDLVRLYFFPEAWEEITRLDKREAAQVILRALMVTAIEESGRPQVVGAEQARFYWETGVTVYRDMAQDWTRAQKRPALPV